jgi:hypothetical protein
VRKPIYTIEREKLSLTYLFVIRVKKIRKNSVELEMSDGSVKSLLVGDTLNIQWEDEGQWENKDGHG